MGSEEEGEEGGGGAKRARLDDGWMAVYGDPHPYRRPPIRARRRVTEFESAPQKTKKFLEEAKTGLEEEKKAGKEEADKLRHQINVQTARCKEATDKLVVWEKKSVEWKDKEQKMKKQIEQLDSKLAQNDKELADRLRAVNEAKLELCQAKEEIVNLKKRNLASEEKVRSLKVDLDKADNKSVESADQMNKEVATLKDEHAAMLTQVQDAGNRVAQIANENETLRAENMDLGRRLEVQQTKDNETVQMLRVQVDRLTDQLNRAQHQAPPVPTPSPPQPPQRPSSRASSAHSDAPQEDQGPPPPAPERQEGEPFHQWLTRRMEEEGLTASELAALLPPVVGGRHHGHRRHESSVKRLASGQWYPPTTIGRWEREISAVFANL